MRERFDAWRTINDVADQALPTEQARRFKRQLALRPFARRNAIDLVEGNASAMGLIEADEDGSAYSIVGDIMIILKLVMQLWSEIEKLIGRF